jgi:hypothetical protein
MVLFDVVLRRSRELCVLQGQGRIRLDAQCAGKK